jgi:hypothetical protein
MAKKMPMTIKVGAHTYTVLRKSKAQMGEDAGTCDYTMLQFAIRRLVRRSLVQETLLHEVLHACSYPTFADVTEEHEKLIEAISPVLLQVIQDNPDLIDYLRSGKTK